ncbi:DUF4097 family beta strand repeat-containing protein [Dyadobacter sediminis]|uniref:Uncharacterized protein n=1 Tax=Dyadobacter sediminis TaxID=1493691 RepID=A0A5R9KBQ3_9BACT|nr:DUF4097 family beta strand repeat-containing protein [Dyadobacter sediminis]TLU92251.1 hypothetical protein FEM55_16055 [Dyadobacter sediminis]GGB96162.1 hypothetical protein GCM10011325_24350 [Dyadobacter sediminis]
MKPLFYAKFLTGCFLLACLTAGNVSAQVVLQVATKTIAKTVSASSVRTLYISAEKADVEIITWEKAEISILMELSARHPDKNTAATDLFKAKYIADRNGKDYFLRNYILLKNGESKPVSNLRTRYTIHLPAACAVDLKNSFGTVTLKGLTNNLQLKADFCTTYLSGMQGKGQVNTSFGELKGDELSGDFSFSSDHTRLFLERMAGNIKVNAEYGNVELHPGNALSSLSIRSKKAEITLMTRNWQQFDYAINSAYATMKLPNGFRWKRNTADFKEAFFSRNQLANVDINAEFGQVTIK